MTEPIRVLQVVASLNAGGMENYIMNLYRMVDKSKVQFDFVVHHAAVGLYEDEIQKLGGKIYHFTVLDDKNVVKYISELNRFFDEHKEYQIIHGHLSSLAVFYLGVAKKYNVPWRIAHSHGAGFLHTLKGTAKYLLLFSSIRAITSPIRTDLAVSSPTDRLPLPSSRSSSAFSCSNCGISCSSRSISRFS